MHVAYFLEDIGHERFLRALCHRIFQEQHVALEDLTEEVLNSTGGKARARREFESFLRDYPRTHAGLVDITVVAQDTDCQGENVVRGQLEDSIRSSSYSGAVVFAIPDPHIEVWYLADPLALQRAVNSPTLLAVPEHRCDPQIYKTRLIDVFRQAGFVPLLGGVEYADEIVDLMDLY